MASHILLLVALVLLVPQGRAASAASIDVKPKIIGGDTAMPGQFPYQASVRRLSWFVWKHRCAGTLITKDWVVTTASCVEGAWFLRVAAGKIDLKNQEDGEQEVAVSKTIAHPDFNRKKPLWLADIALLRTSSPFEYTGYVRPARLPNTSFDPTGKALLVTGWGVSDNGGWFGWGRHRSDKLLVTVVQTTPCTTTATDGGESGGMCVLKDSTSTPCEGDEGDAMVQMLMDDTFTVVGMVTRVPTDCKDPKVPSAAVNIYEQMQFIESTMT